MIRVHFLPCSDAHMNILHQISLTFPPRPKQANEHTHTHKLNKHGASFSALSAAAGPFAL